MRKLLPYEHQLIESLGITKEQYLEFVAIQQEYKDPKVGTALDVRNADGGATVAIILTVVGILFQVGAALLAPKPEIPDISDRRRRNREQRFAPTFGFNSTQELASYGDPVNLVYTNQNPSGNVRVAGSLVWSAVDSFGSTQFMRLVLALGASEIKEIDYKKTAFGQLSFTDLDRENIYVFEGVNKPPIFNNFVDGFAGKTRYPQLLKPSTDGHPAFMCLNYGFRTHLRHRLGFSQAYTPTSHASLGVFDAIPINVDVTTRNKKGKTESENIEVKLRSGYEDNNIWRNAPSTGASFKKGDKIVVFFNDLSHPGNDKDPRDAARDLRRQMAETLDFGSTYMLGAAKFRLEGYIGSDRIVTKSDEVEAKFVCVETGQVPSADYDTVKPIQYTEDELDEIETKFQETLDILNGDENVTTGIKLKVRKGGAYAVNMEFNGTIKVEWTPKYKSEVSLNYNSKNGQENVNLATRLGKVTQYFPKAGSIAYTNDLIGQTNAGFGNDENEDNDLVIKTKTLRKKAKKQKKALKQLVDDIKAGIFDGGEAGEQIPNITFQYTDSIDTYNVYRNGGSSTNVVPGNAFEGRGPNGQTWLSTVTCFGLSQFDFDRFFANHVPTDTTHKDVETGSSREPYCYTFRYRASDGVLHFFNFTGIQDDRTDIIFPNDQKLKNRRTKLQNAIEKTQNAKNDNTDLNKNTIKIKKDSVVDPNANRVVLQRSTSPHPPEYNDFQDALKKEDERRSKVEERINKLISQRRAEAISIIENDIELINQFLEELPADEQIPDRVGKKEVRKKLKALRTEKHEARNTLEAYLDEWPKLFTETLDNRFFTKCLVKAESAAYTTINKCHAVIFSLKSRLYRRISGRQKKYADRKVDGYSNSDNGVKSRIAFFRFFYRQVGTTNYINVPHIFAIRHGSDADFYTQFTFFCERQEKWEFKFEPVFDMQAEIRNRSFFNYFFLENTDKISIQNVTDNAAVDSGTSGEFRIAFPGRVVSYSSARKYFPDEEERGPYLTNEWDMFSVNSDTQVQFSFESGPEIKLTAVTEQQLDADYVNKYKKMQMMSLGAFAGRGIQDLRNVTALVTEGKKCRTVENTNAAANSSSYAPDIFVDTVLDPDNGIGKYVDVVNVDTTSLSLAKSFCKNNKLPLHELAGKNNLEFFMDGIIADVGSWREFWVNNAPFSLLELARKNGIDTLVPALPCKNSGEAADNNGVPVEVPISALFTTGNILEDSYKEEFLNYGTATEDIIASVIYREYNDKEIFSTKQSVDVHRNDPEFSASSAIRETFDLSQFVSQREQAIMFGKLLCNQRRYIRKGIEFRTFPSEAVIEPGDFVFVDIGLQDWDRYSAGVVMENGELNTPLSDAPINGTYEFLFYNPATGDVAKRSSVTVTNNDTAFNAFAGYMFVMGIEKPQKRVYRVTEIAIEEEGEVAIKAIEYPCFVESGRLCARIADFRATNFEVS